MQQMVQGYIFTGNTRYSDSTLCNVTVLCEIKLHYIYVYLYIHIFTHIYYVSCHVYILYNKLRKIIFLVLKKLSTNFA